MPTESSSSIARSRASSLLDLRPVGPDRLDDLGADPVDRVERGHRVLEDHRDLGAAHLLQLALARRRAAPARAAAPSPRSSRSRERDQPHDRLRGDALARARLADDRQHLARLELEGDAVDRLHVAVFGGEADAQVLTRAALEQRLASLRRAPQLDPRVEVGVGDVDQGVEEDDEEGAEEDDRHDRRQVEVEQRFVGVLADRR